MKKNMLIGKIIGRVSLLCLGIVLMLLSGCLGNNSKDHHSFKAVEIYPQLAELPTSIEVTFRDEYDGTYIIEDAKEIKDIYELIIKRTYKFVPGLPAPGTNRVLKFIYNEKESIRLSTRYIRIGDDLYYPTYNDDLDILIQEIGLERNAIFTR